MITVTHTSCNTVELRFIEPPREAKIGSTNREARNIEGKITVKQMQGKRLLVRVIGFFLEIEGSRNRGYTAIQCNDNYSNKYKITRFLKLVNS